MQNPKLENCRKNLEALMKPYSLKWLGQPNYQLVQMLRSSLMRRCQGASGTAREP